MRAVLLVSFVLSHAPLALGAQQTQEETWDVTRPRGVTRTIEFPTTEGTWMSADLAPDGTWIAFDLLGHIHRMPAAGGDAEVLTQGSGIAINTHPRISPDGRHIAFVSDRGGQNNLWIMEADGSNPRAVFTDPNVRVAMPAWSADGTYLVVVRSQFPAGGQGGSGGIWMYHRDGGSGVELVSTRTQPGASWPSLSRDGRFLYFQVNAGAGQPGYSGRRDFLGGGVQVRRMDLRTGEIVAISSGEQSQQLQTSSGGMGAPEVSPDGRFLAFVRRIPDGTISWRGHRFGPRSALWLRDLVSGAERLLMDPVEQDIMEGGKVLRPFPGYAWSADGRSIVISQGGKLRRLDLTSSAVTEIPFRVQVHRVISELANTQTRIEDDSLPIRFPRWHTASPDGQRLVFQAVGRLWIMDLPDGTPRRLTPESFEPFEFAPAWSPDGQWIAFTSWDDAEAAHVWRIRVSRTGPAVPERLTRVPGEYVNPAWSPDGRELVLARGAGETRHGRGLVWNQFWDLVRLPSSGGDLTPVVRIPTSVDGSSGGAFNSVRNQIVRPSWGPEGRIWYPHLQVEAGQLQSTLYSIRPDGLDRHAHLTFPFADEVAIAPDGRHVAFQESDNVHVVPIPSVGTGGKPIRIEPRRSRLPVTRLSTEGGLFPRWRSAAIVEFGSGDRYYAWDLNTRITDTVTIRLRVARDIPEGSMAFTNARILTMRNREVVAGTLVVRGNRIACVGPCPVPQGARVFDAAGTTIIPGLIDVHSHNYREHRGIIPRQNYEGASFLAYGVTTTMDPSMWSQNLFPTAELVEAGQVVGPRVFTTGDPLYRGDGSRQEDFTSAAAAEAGIAKLRHWGAVSLKQYQQPRRQQRQWVMEAARKFGLQVTSENGDLEYTLGMIMDGHTGFEHPMSYTPLYGDVTTFFGRARATYSPTFMVGGPGPWNEEFWYQESEVWKDPKTRRFMPWVQHVPQTRRRMLNPVTDYSYPWIALGMADVIAAGGFGAIGAHGQHNGLGSHWEVWMAAAATGAMGALEVATLHGARFIGKEQDLGSIEVGKLADLVVLEADPLTDIRNTRAIRWVVKGGAVYDDETLDELWPRQRPFGTPWWLVPDALRQDDKPLRP